MQVGYEDELVKLLGYFFEWGPENRLEHDMCGWVPDCTGHLMPGYSFVMCVCMYVELRIVIRLT